MARAGFGSDASTAAVLTRAGWKLSERSVSRIRQERRHPPQPPSDPHRAVRPVVAHFVNHVWMMDVTEIHAFLGPSFDLASVFDAFSRVPLALGTFKAKPGASAMARLLKAAARSFGAAKYVITDQGGEFKGRVFRKTAARLSIKHRLGTTDRIFATARLERLWRTLKESARLRLAAPLTVASARTRGSMARHPPPAPRSGPRRAQHEIGHRRPANPAVIASVTPRAIHRARGWSLPCLPPTSTASCEPP